MGKKYATSLILLLLLVAGGSVLLAACTRPGSSSSTGGHKDKANKGNSTSNGTVHMGEMDFAQPTITISKGSKLTLIDDVSVTHIIQNGTWDNGTPKLAKENGAPTVSLTFSGADSQSVGPFNTAGTYHLYCTIHPAMNLTVTVK